jgi:hypothetical protein
LSSKKKTESQPINGRGLHTLSPAVLAAERQWGIGHALLASLRDCVFACAVPLYDFWELKLELICHGLAAELWR